MNNQDYANSFVNFDALIAGDETELAKLDHTLDAAVQARNTLTLSEFRNYVPLFKIDGREVLGDAAYEVLAKEYFTTITPYHPVHIVNNHDRSEVIFVLPPIFNKVSCVTELGEVGADAVTAFHNAHEQADDFNIKKSNYTSLLIDVFNAAQNSAQSEETKQLTADILKELEAKQIIKTNTGTKDTQQAGSEVSAAEAVSSNEVEYL